MICFESTRSLLLLWNDLVEEIRVIKLLFLLLLLLLVTLQAMHHQMWVSLSPSPSISFSIPLLSMFLEYEENKNQKENNFDIGEKSLPESKFSEKDTEALYLFLAVCMCVYFLFSKA